MVWPPMPQRLSGRRLRKLTAAASIAAVQNAESGGGRKAKADGWEREEESGGRVERGKAEREGVSVSGERIDRYGVND